MATSVIFIEIPEWTWHYNPALDTLILAARNSFRLYIFFRHSFSILVVSWHFEPRRPYADFPLCLAHPLYFLESAPSISSMETDPFEGSSPIFVLHVAKFGSSSASTEVLPKMQIEEDPEEPVLDNGFHTP